VAIDCLNHGKSGKPEPMMRGRAEDVIEMMDHLFTKVVLPGKSDLTAIEPGYMPKEYLEALVKFINANDLKRWGLPSHKAVECLASETVP
jgi:hypothetical protein